MCICMYIHVYIYIYIYIHIHMQMQPRECKKERRTYKNNPYNNQLYKRAQRPPVRVGWAANENGACHTTCTESEAVLIFKHK